MHQEGITFSALTLYTKSRRETKKVNNQRMKEWTDYNKRNLGPFRVEGRSKNWQINIPQVLDAARTTTTSSTGAKDQQA